MAALAFLLGQVSQVRGQALALFCSEGCACSFCLSSSKSSLYPPWCPCCTWAGWTLVGQVESGPVILAAWVVSALDLFPGKGTHCHLFLDMETLEETKQGGQSLYSQPLPAKSLLSLGPSSSAMLSARSGVPAAAEAGTSPPVAASPHVISSPVDVPLLL